MDILDGIRRFFNDAIPFNRFLQLRLIELDTGHAVVEVPFRPEYIGDIGKNIIHGGVISTLIDVTGGATAFSVLDFPRETSLNTVDMRVDYIRMGRGRAFRATGTVLRKGNRICVTRIEVSNDEGTLVAHGTATYSIFSHPPERLREDLESLRTRLSTVEDAADSGDNDAQ
jgi:uncharacterized protein (TIGR00369 family)